jgi:hypothetical protein
VVIAIVGHQERVKEVWPLEDIHHSNHSPVLVDHRLNAQGLDLDQLQLQLQLQLLVMAGLLDKILTGLLVTIRAMLQVHLPSLSGMTLRLFQGA